MVSQARRTGHQPKRGRQGERKGEMGKEEAMIILTQLIRPPVPSRSFDWSAIDEDSYDGAPDSPNRNEIGYGATEEEAIKDLEGKLE